jgi:hypothetical protein
VGYATGHHGALLAFDAEEPFCATLQISSNANHNSGFYQPVLHYPKRVISLVVLVARKRCARQGHRLCNEASSAARGAMFRQTYVQSDCLEQRPLSLRRLCPLIGLRMIKCGDLHTSGPDYYSLAPSCLSGTQIHKQAVYAVESLMVPRWILDPGILNAASSSVGLPSASMRRTLGCRLICSCAIASSASQQHRRLFFAKAHRSH